MANDRSSAPPSSDRRTDARHLACFPAYLELEARGTRLALISDISITGALLLTQTVHQPNEHVTLKLYVDGNPDAPRQALARVIRFERCSFDRADVWPYRIAVQFDEPIADLQHEVEALAARQAELKLHVR
jgi:hypothetical protein